MVSGSEWSTCTCVQATVCVCVCVCACVVYGEWLFQEREKASNFWSEFRTQGTWQREEHAQHSVDQQPVVQGFTHLLDHSSNLWEVSLPLSALDHNQYRISVLTQNKGVQSKPCWVVPW